MKRSYILYILLCSLFFASCDKKTPLPIGNGTATNPGSTKEQKLLNVAYGVSDTNVMDVYLPQGRNINTPVVILVHGGYWNAGDKSSMGTLQDDLLASGVASVNVNYRLTDTNRIHYDTLLQDLKMAIDFCSKKCLEWNIKSQKYIILGVNSGGHLALLYSYKSQDPRISAIVALSAPSDLTDGTFLGNMQTAGKIISVETLTGDKYIPGSLATSFWNASPFFFLKKVPALLIHGTNDALVPYSQSQNLYNNLNAQGFYCRLYPISGGGQNLNVDKSTPAFGEMKSWIFQYGN